MFDLWVKACEEFDTSIFPLEGDDEVGLYKTQRERFDGRMYHPTNIYYHVWYNGKHEVFQDYVTAYEFWKARNEEVL